MSIFPLKVPKRPASFPLKIQTHTIGCVNSYTNGIVGVKKDGTVYAVSEPNSNYLLDLSLVKDVVSVQGCQGALVLLKKNGTIITTSNSSMDNTSDISSLNNIVDISISANSSYHYCALKSDGTIVSNITKYYSELAKHNDIIQVSIGYYSSNVAILKKDGTVVSYGSYMYTDPWGAKSLKTEGLVAGFDDIVQITSSRNDLLGLKSDGTVVSLHKNTDTYRAVSTWKNIVKIKAEHNCGVAGLKSDGTVITTSNELNAKISSWNNIVDILAGSGNIYVIGLKSDGSCLFALANGSSNYIEKTLVPTLSSWNVALPSIEKNHL